MQFLDILVTKTTYKIADHVKLVQQFFKPQSNDLNYILLLNNTSGLDSFLKFCSIVSFSLF